MLNNMEAAIFDLDGTLIDSMWIWNKIDHDFLNNRKIIVPDDLSYSISHLTFIEAAHYFKNTFNLPESVESIMNEWDEMSYLHYSNTIKLKKGAYDYLIKLKKLGLKIALATSNSRRLLEAVLKNNNVYDLFDAITTSDEVKRGKGSPDIYLLTSEKIGVEPKKCLVFEDILPAVKSAKSIGMKVVGVYDNNSLHEHEKIKQLCDHFITCFDELL